MSITEKGFKIPEDNLTQFQGENSLLKTSESNTEQYKCSLCFISFASKLPLLVHLREEHWAKGTKPNQQKPSFEFKVENNRSRVNIIKEEDILYNEKELSKKMVFNTNTEKSLILTRNCIKSKKNI